MPCNAVATAQAQVAAEHLRAYLTPDTIELPLLAYLRARYPQTTIAAERIGEICRWTLRAGGTVTTLTVRAGQAVVTNYPPDPLAANALAEEITTTLAAIGAVYWQRATAQLLAQWGTITEQTTAADGSLVLRLRV